MSNEHDRDSRSGEYVSASAAEADPENTTHEVDAPSAPPTGLRVGDRHPAVAHFGPLFAYNHLRGDRRGVSRSVATLAQLMVDNLPDSPELSAGLRDLLRAKDCFVRCVVDS